MTRPRPAAGPSIAGAVDLSALKQRAPSDGGSPGEGSVAPSGVEITEANFEAEVIARSNQVPVVVVLWSPRSDASVQLGDKLASLAKAQWRSPEWEIGLAIAGIVLFALALNALWFGINVVTSK